MRKRKKEWIVPMQITKRGVSVIVTAKNADEAVYKAKADAKLKQLFHSQST